MWWATPQNPVIKEWVIDSRAQGRCVDHPLKATQGRARKTAVTELKKVEGKAAFWWVGCEGTQRDAFEAKAAPWSWQVEGADASPTPPPITVVVRKPSLPKSVGIGNCWCLATAQLFCLYGELQARTIGGEGGSAKTQCTARAGLWWPGRMGLVSGGGDLWHAGDGGVLVGGHVEEHWAR